MKRRFYTYQLMGIFVFCILALDSGAQEMLLRHQFQPGQTINAMTQVQMQGDSFLTGEKLATQLRMQMRRDMLINEVDSLGNAKIDVYVQRIRTQGKMENASFNKDLTGSELSGVMFGADQMKMEVSPLGNVRGRDDLGLQQLGVTLPSSLGDSGGFEFPTFPVSTVRVGDSWTDSGELLRGVNLQRSDLAGDCIYKLYRVYNSPQGRIGVIRYQKVTDLSGLGLGGSSAAGQAQSGVGSVKAGGLVIQLEGEIEFNIDKGKVVKTTQRGFWNMDLNMDMGGSNAGSMGALGAPSSQKQNLGLKQNMKIQLSTQFQWTGQQNQQTPQTPAGIQPPKMEDLPKVKTEAKEIP
ncbi:MAG: hypothetical protein JXR73_16745 [Candidatus Omnitrophica bacterium]|nr:hypothetical protein [Candidatus Omnitrophota bacterium]